MNIEIIKNSQIICGKGGPIADVTFDTPVFTGTRAAKRLTKYYIHAEACLINYLKQLPNPLNLPVSVRFTVTHNKDDLISLYRDIIFSSSCIRIADTWKNGYPFSIKETGLSRQSIMDYCLKQAEALSRSGYVQLYPEYKKLIHKQYRPECFYIQDGSAIVFYNAGVIARKGQRIIIFKCPIS